MVNSPHAVVARSSTTPEHDRKLGHIRTRHRRDEFRPILRDTASLRILANHETTDILQKHQRDIPLCTQLDEMRALERGLTKQDAVIRNDANRVSVDLRKASDECRSIQWLELAESAVVDYAGDDLVRRYLRLEVRAYDATEFFWIIHRLLPVFCLVWVWCTRIGEVADAAAGQDQSVCVVFGEVVRYARDFAVQESAAEIFGTYDFACCGFYKWWPGKEDVALVAHDDGFVGHAGDVGATGCTRAHYNGDLRDIH